MSGIADVRAELGERLYIPQIDWSFVSVAAFAANGQVLAAKDGFPETDADEIVAAWKDRRGVMAPVQGQYPDGAAWVVALVPRDISGRWNLAADARRILIKAGDGPIGVCVSPPGNTTGLVWACERLGFTPMQSRIVSALVRQGDLKLAARQAGVSYATARDALAQAMERAGARKRTRLVERVARLAFGILPEGERGDDLLRDVWGLTSRQAQLAVALAEGASRDAAARLAGVSPQVAKKDLSAVFETLGVTSGAALAAQLSQVACLSALVRLAGEDIHFSFDRTEPLRLIAAASGGRMIAVSDYGPQTGKPVLILHSSMASRQAPSVLVSELQRRGFRPFSIDRPGFGLTDVIEGPGDPFALACEDIRTVCDTLRIRTIDIVARGGAQVAVHFAAQSPERVGRVVLVAPDPPNRASKPMSGFLGATKRAVQTNPELMESFARLFVGNLRRMDARDIVRRAVAASAPDLAVMQDPRNFADYQRGFQIFLSGKVKGYVREQAALVTAPDPPRPSSAGGWTILIGMTDPLHDPAETEAYWRGLLPQADVKLIADAGRFIVMSHPGLVCDCLAPAQAD